MAQPGLENDGETVLVPRVKSFTNQYITKSNYTDFETNITKVAVLVFDSDKTLVHLDEVSGESVILNKSMLNSSATQTEKLKSATVVMFANMKLADIKKEGAPIIDNKTDLTPDDLENYTCHFAADKTVIPAPLTKDFEGFPMVGSTTCDLSATKDKSDPITVDLKILYAKINFSITAESGTENDEYEGVNVAFTLNKYSVHNASRATKLDDITASEEIPDAATESRTYAFDEEAKTYTPDTENQFTFYVAENRYNPYTGSKPDYPDYASLSEMGTIYPSDWLTPDSELDVKDQTVDQPNGVKYFYDDLIQQYKPNLVEKAPAAAGKPTYVTLTGVYTDYRGTLWDVDYDIYLGKDNAHNFHVDRNSEYTNYITIKGIRNNGSYGEGQVWVDHRVDVSLNSDSPNEGADCVTITRETLIDSHIEVRPLRVKWEEDKFAGVRVYLPTNSDGSLVSWIGIERFTGNNCQEGATYCYVGGKSIGKRKYFTTDLISELQTKGGEFGVNTDGNDKFIFLLNGECAWIYFDENVFTTTREAEIRLAFYTTSGDTQNAVYKVKQCGLKQLGAYNIETYEEYLHSYDSYDKYNLATNPIDYTRQGLAWGLENQTVSEDIIVSATTLNGIQNYVSQRYDYFHSSDIPVGESYYTYIKNDAGSWVDATYGTGLEFTDRASYKKEITVKDMGTKPDNAYQYCLSKNKFTEDADGGIRMDIHWYLPDVYELKSVLSASQNDDSSNDFDRDCFYWSSQPAIGGGSLDILGREVSIKDEISTSARAVSLSETKDISRSIQNRIRCFYSVEGLPANMTDRTPEGIGGNFIFWMKAYNDNSPAFFNYKVTDIEPDKSEEKTEYQYTNSTYPYPDFANPGNEFGYFSNVIDKLDNKVSGFSKNPANQDNWNEYSYTIWGNTTYTGYYYTLATYPGLSANTLEKYTRINAYKPLSTPKSDTKVVTIKFAKKLELLVSTQNLNTLDHLTGGKMLDISFSNGNNTSYSPKFDYSEYMSGSQEVTTTRYWRVPSYPEMTYTPKDESVTKTYQGTGTGTGTGSNYIGDKGKSQAQNAAREAALEDAKSKARDEYPNRTYSYGTATYTDIDKGYTSSWGVTTYTMEAICSIEITCTSVSSQVPYYGDATGGGWDSGTTTKKDLDGIDTDELKMYCGNSFTISLSDAVDEEGLVYKDNYEITKVKVHYSGDTFIKEGGGFLGIGVHKYYTRFVDSEIQLPQTLSNVPIYGSTETLQLEGMDYNENDDGTGTHQWAGEGRNSVTLVLSDYIINNNSGTSYTYRYDVASTDLTKYLIIDKIEVKCTKKSTE